MDAIAEFYKKPGCEKYEHKLDSLLLQHQLDCENAKSEKDIHKANTKLMARIAQLKK